MSLKKKRKFARNYNGGPISISALDNKISNNAMMDNYSVNGMNFITDFAVRPGSDINIEVLKQSLENNLPNPLNDFSAKVIWCKQLSDEAGYAIGVRFKKMMDQ